MKGMTNASGSSEQEISLEELDTILDEILVPPTPPTTEHRIYSHYSNCDNSNKTQYIAHNVSYRGEITANSGYTLESAYVTIEMGGVNITNAAWDEVTGIIFIEHVTNDVNIMVAANPLPGGNSWYPMGAYNSWSITEEHKMVRTNISFIRDNIDQRMANTLDDISQSTVVDVYYGQAIFGVDQYQFYNDGVNIDGVNYQIYDSVLLQLYEDGGDYTNLLPTQIMPSVLTTEDGYPHIVQGIFNNSGENALVANQGAGGYWIVLGVTGNGLYYVGAKKAIEMEGQYGQLIPMEQGE